MARHVLRGRPPVTSREVIEEAACELFLEQGFAGASVSDIAQRAGVSRSTFFNYYQSKSDIVWRALDVAIDSLFAALAAIAPGGESIEDVTLRVFGESEHGVLALSICHADAMGMTEELVYGRAVRAGRITEHYRRALVRLGVSKRAAAIGAAAHTEALFGAIWEWALLGAGSNSYADVLNEWYEEMRRPLTPVLQ